MNRSGVILLVVASFAVSALAETVHGGKGRRGGGGAMATSGSFSVSSNRAGNSEDFELDSAAELKESVENAEELSCKQKASAARHVCRAFGESSPCQSALRELRRGPCGGELKEALGSLPSKLHKVSQDLKKANELIAGGKQRLHKMTTSKPSTKSVKSTFRVPATAQSSVIQPLSATGGAAKCDWAAAQGIRSKWASPASMRESRAFLKRQKSCLTRCEKKHGKNSWKHCIDFDATGIHDDLVFQRGGFPSTKIDKRAVEKWKRKIYVIERQIRLLKTKKERADTVLEACNKATARQIQPCLPPEKKRKHAVANAATAALRAKTPVLERSLAEAKRKLYRAEHWKALRWGGCPFKARSLGDSKRRKGRRKGKRRRRRRRKCVDKDSPFICKKSKCKSKFTSMRCLKTCKFCRKGKGKSRFGRRRRSKDNSNLAALIAQKKRLGKHGAKALIDTKKETKYFDRNADIEYEFFPLVPYADARTCAPMLNPCNSLEDYYAADSGCVACRHGMTPVMHLLSNKSAEESLHNRKNPGLSRPHLWPGKTNQRWSMNYNTARCKYNLAMEFGTVGGPAAANGMQCSPADTTELAWGGTKFTRPVSCIMSGFKLLPQIVGSHKEYVVWNIVCNVWKLVYCVSTRRGGTGDYQRTCANSKRVQFMLADSGRNRGVSLKKDEKVENSPMVSAAPHCQHKLRSVVGTLPLLFKDAKDPESKGSFGDFETCQKLSQNGAKAGYKRMLKRASSEGVEFVKFTDRYAKMAAYARKTGHVEDKEWRKRIRALHSEERTAPTVTYSDIAPFTSCKTFDYSQKTPNVTGAGRWKATGNIDEYNIASGGKFAHKIFEPIVEDRLKTGKPLTLHEAFYFNMDVPARCKTKEMLAKFAWRTWCMSCAADENNLPPGRLPIKNKKYTKFYPYSVTGLKGLTEDRLGNAGGSIAGGNYISTRSNYVDGDGMKRYMSLKRVTKPHGSFESLPVPPVLVTSLDKLPPALKEYNRQAGICSLHATTV